MRPIVAAAVLLVIAVAGAPIALVRISQIRFRSAFPLAGVDPPWRWRLAEIGSALSSPLDDASVVDLIIRLSLVMIWVAVVVIVVTTAAEVFHMVRHGGIHRPTMRGIGIVQPIARVIATGLLALAPLHTPKVSLAGSSGDAARYGLTVPAGRPADDVQPAGTGRPDTHGDAEHAPIDVVHIVRRGESVFSIAAELAGDDQDRTVEIANEILDVNLGRAMPGGGRFTSAAYIESGWRLTIPGHLAGTRSGEPSAGPSGAARVIEPGDTLFDIAEEVLGDGDRWPAIWEANAGAEMSDGRTFEDPHLILPGWSIVVPEPSGPPDRPESTPASDGPPADVPAQPSATTTTTTPTRPDTPATTTTTTPTRPDTPATTTTTTSIAPPVPTATTTTTTTITAAPAATTPTAAGPSTPPAGSAGPTSTTGPEAAVGGGPPADGLDDGTAGIDGPQVPGPIRVEHAAMVAAGLLGLLAVRRRRRLRSARPGTRIPEPKPSASAMERKLRLVDPGERAQRVDVAVRAAAAGLLGSDVQIGLVISGTDGGITVHLTGEAALPPPWTGAGSHWVLPAALPIELVSSAARLVGTPCIALAQLGVTPDGGDVLVDLEACPVLRIDGDVEVTDEIVTALTTALAASPYAEVAHLITVSVPEMAMLDHRNAHRATTSECALELAATLVGAEHDHPGSSFARRSMRTGGETWEPAVVLLRADDTADDDVDGRPSTPGGGIAVVAANHPSVDAGGSAPCRLRPSGGGWRFEGFGTEIRLTPIGLAPADVDAIAELLDAPPPTPIAVGPAGNGSSPADGRSDSLPVEIPHSIVVGVLGEVHVVDVDGRAGSFERSKTVELIAWLATHRERSTRTAARTALWEIDVRDATFANVVSEARRALARLVPPPDGEEWLARTLNEQLPLHDLVVTDAQLVQRRLDVARTQTGVQAIETLRPAVEMIRGMPFAGTSYLWPDAEGLTSALVLLAIGAAGEMASHALAVDDIESVFWASGRGLTVLPGHEELIALRMRAHARSGDLAGVRHEWESYERVVVADAWSDGEPAPKLVALRRELLSTPEG